MFILCDFPKYSFVTCQLPEDEAKQSTIMRKAVNGPDSSESDLFPARRLVSPDMADAELSKHLNASFVCSFTLHEKTPLLCAPIRS